MLISAADLEWYRTAMVEVAQKASEYVAGELRHSRGAGVTRIRDAAIAALTDSVGIHGDMAQALAGQLFDEVRDAEGLEAATFELYDDVVDPTMLEDKVHYLARNVVEGRRDVFVDGCGMLADMYAWMCNREAMVRNCAREGMRYARIPTGPDTCDFCLMLASRGFVYHSAESAGASSHRSCDCVVVPGVGGDEARSSTQVEGYDPDMLYDLWQGRVDERAKANAERKGTTAEVERANIIARLEEAASAAHRRNDRKWRNR
jgi:hypothetical protein